MIKRLAWVLALLLTLWLIWAFVITQSFAACDPGQPVGPQLATVTTPS